MSTETIQTSNQEHNNFCQQEETTTITATTKNKNNKNKNMTTKFFFSTYVFHCADNVNSSFKDLIEEEFLVTIAAIAG